VAEWGARGGQIAAAAAFFGGMIAMAVIDKLLPEEKNPHNMAAAGDAATELEVQAGQAKLMRMGLITALGIAVHNFPEGLATFASGLQTGTVAVMVAVTVAIHNIPEGIAVSVPIYYATGSRKKAFAYSFLSGLAEPVGGLIGYAILAPFLSPAVLGLTFAAVAGIMVFIALDELMPTARAYGEQHLAIYGTMSGMAVMALSLLLFV
jgi:ZIP family zinc transporter